MFKPFDKLLQWRSLIQKMPLNENERNPGNSPLDWFIVAVGMMCIGKKEQIEHIVSLKELKQYLDDVNSRLLDICTHEHGFPYMKNVCNIFYIIPTEFSVLVILNQEG